MSFLEGLLWLSLNIYYEARGEPEKGKLAVAHVTLNRAREQDKNIAAIVAAPYQFSWTINKEDYLPNDIKTFLDCTKTALKSLTTPDFTGGATFFHRYDINPFWAAHKTFVGRHGSHDFYSKNPSSSTSIQILYPQQDRPKEETVP
jgi:N-acetylmuramoyl-L-alanine amidase